jgi:ornithine decarboxylase
VNPPVTRRNRGDAMQTIVELPEEGRPFRLTPAELARLDHPTPYLLMDLDAVERAYGAMTRALAGVAIHYAVKCNPDPRILSRLKAAGSAFEIASYSELQTLTSLGVRADEVIFSNPVKPWTQIREAARAGVWRFAFDSRSELDKLATHAPGAAVSVRLGTRKLGSKVPSEGKFGVDVIQAVQLMRDARSLGLRPYGIAFHVGSQMTDPRAWEDATRQSARVLRALQAHDITLGMLNIGGGFPARYADPVPELAGYGACIRRAVQRHLPYPLRLCAEPGRALVAEAGVLVATVIGTAERAGSSWLHLDVGAFNGMIETLLTQNRLVYPLADSRATDERRRYHITGPTCDSQDTMFFGVPLSRGLVPGDRVYIYTAGAYTTCYASTFNGCDAPTTHCLP